MVVCSSYFTTTCIGTSYIKEEKREKKKTEDK